MDEDRFKASLAAKVDVSVRMAQVFAQEQMDWVLFFSSLCVFSYIETLRHVKRPWNEPKNMNFDAGCLLISRSVYFWL